MKLILGVKGVSTFIHMWKSNETWILFSVAFTIGKNSSKLGKIYRN